MGKLNNKIGYILCETATTSEDTKKPTIVEQSNNRVIVEAVLQDMNVKNRNGRFYASPDMTPELKSSRLVELMKTGNLKGENGHPSSKDIVRQQTVDPMKVCCKYLKLWTDGNNIMAHVTGTQNELGKNFNDDILVGEFPSFSLRALGTIENTTRGAEVRNIKIITWDRVIYPSHSAAYMTKVVSESSIYLPKDGNKLLVEKDDPGLIVPVTNESVINYIKSQSSNLKSIKESFDVFYDNICLTENGKSVQLSDKIGNIFVVNLETYIQNEIYNYCSR